ncbi:MAG TPA: hypothetical protein PLL06_01510 [Acidobacteriota bacterium]|nr:hypothetical protein [Acidobacteriota bacterium]HNG95667.1 hypothetical protein [Acidobacteriota bacterium]
MRLTLKPQLNQQITQQITRQVTIFQPEVQPEPPRLTLGSVLRCQSASELRAIVDAYLVRIGCPNATVDELRAAGRTKEANLIAVAETRLAELPQIPSPHHGAGSSSGITYNPTLSRNVSKSAVATKKSPPPGVDSSSPELHAFQMTSAGTSYCLDASNVE